MNKTLLFGCLLSLCVVPFYESKATMLSAHMLYEFTKQGNEQALSQYRNKINLVDSNGNTALCYAVQNNDSESYLILKRYGADTKVPCLQNTVKEKDLETTDNTYKTQTTNKNSSASTFLGMGKVGWGIVGLATVGGGIALASSGGGGGGSSSSNSNDTPVKAENSGGSDTNNDNITEIDNFGGTLDSDGDYVGLLNMQANNGIISITNIENRDVYGMKNTELTYTTNALKENENNTIQSIINIENYGNNNVYGVASMASSLEYFDVSNAFGAAEETYNMAAEGFIRIDNYGSGNAYGVFAPSDTENYVYNVIPLLDRYPSYKGENSYNRAIGVITLINHGSGTAYGLFGAETDQFSYQEENDQILATTNIINLSNGRAVGLQASDYAENKGDVNIYNLGSGIAYGLKGSAQTSIHNYGNIIITRNTYTDDKLTKTTSDDVTYSASTSNGGRAYGMYGEVESYIENDGLIQILGAEDAIGIYGANGSDDNPTQIVNSGTIDISASDTAYGIVAGGSNVTITNTGTIKINGTENTAVLDSANMKSAAIVLNGATLVNDSTISATSLDLDAFGGNVVATSHATFTADQNITGTLKMASDIVASGFDDVYTTSGTIQANDTSGLSLVSQSALFSTTLAENGHDVILTRKSFNDTVENSSLAQFLEKNYVAQNNEALFSSLKSAESLTEFNNSLNALTGRDMFEQFTFEDLTMLRELNADTNSKLFSNTKKQFSIGGLTTSFAGTNRYTLSQTTSGNRSFGMSVSFSDINSKNDSNKRIEKTYNIAMPTGYQTHGWQIISTPRIGYTYGTYDRLGLSGKSYDGTLEKQIFALMNEMRYPLRWGGWNIAPTLEMNLIGSRLKGHEKGDTYRLTIPEQNLMSVESGIGLYTQRSFNFGKMHHLNLEQGAMIYHEFADPYSLKLGMQDMSGSFKIRDEKRTPERLFLRSGLSYTTDRFELNLSLISMIDKEWQGFGRIGAKFNF